MNDTLRKAFLIELDVIWESKERIEMLLRKRDKTEEVEKGLAMLEDAHYRLKNELVDDKERPCWR